MSCYEKRISGNATMYLATTTLPNEYNGISSTNIKKALSKIVIIDNDYNGSNGVLSASAKLAGFKSDFEYDLKHYLNLPFAMNNLQLAIGLFIENWLDQRKCKYTHDITVNNGFLYIALSVVFYD